MELNKVFECMKYEQKLRENNGALNIKENDDIKKRLLARICHSIVRVIPTPKCTTQPFRQHTSAYQLFFLIQ